MMQLREDIDGYWEGGNICKATNNVIYLATLMVSEWHMETQQFYLTIIS